MKLTSALLLVALAAALPARAAVIVAPSLFGNSSTMPGSPIDFTFFGNPIQFPSSGPDISDNYQSGMAMQPSFLTHFSAHVGANAEYTYGAQDTTAGMDYNPDYGSINTPSGIAGLQKTGILYSVSTQPAPDLVRFTLGASTPTFNFSDFNVYVMFSNAPTSGLDDAQLFASLYDPTGAVSLASASPLVIDGTTTVGTASFEEFHITGAKVGDILQLGAAGANGSASYLSGVSFQSVSAPEPSTWAMLSLGLAALAFHQRRRLVSTL